MPRSPTYRPADPSDTVTVRVPYSRPNQPTVTIEMIIEGQLADVQPATNKILAGGPLHAGGKRIGHYYIVDGPRD